jgi:hypothetical protein
MEAPHATEMRRSPDIRSESELSYGMPLFGGNMAANAFLRTDPGHVERMKNDIGGALRFTLDF